MKIKIIIDGGNIAYVFADNAEAEIEIIDYDRQPVSTAAKEALFQKLNSEMFYMF